MKELQGHWPAGVAMVLSLALLSGGCVSSDDPRPGPQTPVIIIGLDAVRADHLHALGNRTMRTPYLDGLAVDGVLFTNCYSTAPWTGPAFASLFTGLLPYRHGFLGGTYNRLAEEFTTLGELMLGHDYTTASITSVKWLTAPFGMNQGWELSRNFHEGGSSSSGLQVTGLGTEYARRNLERPFLMFLHYYEAHAPYTPPLPFDGMYYAGDARGGDTPIVDFLRSDKVRLLAPKQNAHLYDWLEGVTDLQYPVSQYAAGVSHVDANVGLLMKALKDMGLYDRALIIAVADHGEHLGEHDFWFTHSLPYAETIRVPLIIKFPGNARAGQVVRQGVSVLDVLPTLLAELGLPVPDGLDGVDLAPVLADPGAESQSILVAEQGNKASKLTKALVEGDWKLFLAKDGEEITARLFNLAVDPGETLDVAAQYPERVQRLTARLWSICSGDSPLTAASPLEAVKLDPRDRERLRSLGYVH